MASFSGNGVTAIPLTTLICPGCLHLRIVVAWPRFVPTQQRLGCVLLSQGQGSSGIYALPLIRFFAPLDKVSLSFALPDPDFSL